MSYLVVGDVHGCIEELKELLDAALGDRTLVFVGDLVAKGPDSQAVIALARDHDALAVRGNHDQHVIDAVGDDARHEHHGVRQSLSADDLGWLAALPGYLRLPDVEAIVVHAGLVPGVPLEAQKMEHLLNMRTLRPDGTPSKRLGDGVPWASRWEGPELVVFGHDAVTGLQRWPLAIGLDTGCVYGGMLSGVKLPERHVVQVAAKRPYHPAGR